MGAPRVYFRQGRFHVSRSLSFWDRNSQSLYMKSFEAAARLNLGLIEKEKRHGREKEAAD